MRETKVAARYARSILVLAQEHGKVDKVSEDMALIAGTIGENHELEVMLNSPVIKSDKKNNILSAIFTGKVDPLTMSFITLMTNKNRERVLPEVALQYADQYREAKGIIKAVVTSARPLDDNIKSQIRARIGTSGEIEFIEKIDPALIGGFIVRIGDKQFDGSISRSIIELKKNFFKKQLHT